MVYGKCEKIKHEGHDAFSVTSETCTIYLNIPNRSKDKEFLFKKNTIVWFEPIENGGYKILYDPESGLIEEK